MISDSYASHKRIEYLTAMAAARAEFLAWEASVKLNVVQATGVSFNLHSKPSNLTCACGKPAIRSGKCMPCRMEARAANHPPCACGGPFFAREMCRKCYYKMYNKIRKRPRSHHATS